MSMPAKGNAVLFSEMTPPDDGEDAFNTWYDSHHMPHHVKGVPGFRSGQRYKSPAGPHYLAVYELDSPEVLDSEEYRTRKYTPDAPTKAMLDSMGGFTRYIGNEISFRARDDAEAALDAGVIMAVFFAAPSENWSELIDFYETEHTPMLLECEDWLMVRHMEIVNFNPEPYSHLVLHYLRDISAMDSDALKRSRETEWRKRLGEKAWYDPLFVSYRRRGARVLKDD